MSYVEPLYGEYNFEESDYDDEIKDDSLIEKSVTNGVCVELGYRAFYLLRALDFYSDASQVRGLSKAHPNDAELQKRYTDKEAHRIVSGIGLYRQQGDREFFKAAGVEPFIASGYDDAEMVYIDAQLAANQFVNKYSGSGNAGERKAFRSLLRKQTK